MKGYLSNNVVTEEVNEMKQDARDTEFLVNGLWSERRICSILLSEVAGMARVYAKIIFEVLLWVCVYDKMKLESYKLKSCQLLLSHHRESHMDSLFETTVIFPCHHREKSLHLGMCSLDPAPTIPVLFEKGTLTDKGVFSACFIS